MLRRLALACLVTAFAASAALAAPMTGKVLQVQKKQVRLVLTSKAADWVKKGAAVRFLGARGTIVSVAKDTLVVSTPNAAKTKPGETVTLDKPRAGVAGC